MPIFSQLVHDSCLKTVIAYLEVQELLSLDSALMNHELRPELLKSYQDTKVPAFDAWLFTDRHDFRGIRWTQKVRLHVTHCNLTLKEGQRTAVTNTNEVLWHLVSRRLGDIAGFYVARSSAKDYINDGMLWGGVLTSTFFMAASRGYMDVVRSLMTKGLDINCDRDGEGTPLCLACRWGCVEVVRTLIEAGADINKPSMNGATPMQVASGDKVIEILERAASAS